MNGDEKAAFRNQVRQKLMEMAGIGTGENANYFPTRSSTAGGLPRGPETQWQGQINVMRGMAPNENDIDRAIEAMGGYPAGSPHKALSQMAQSSMFVGQPHPSAMRDGGGVNKTVAPAAPASNPMSLFQQFFQNAEGDRNEARLFNEVRYQQLIDEAGGLRDRRQANVRNWGRAQAELNREKSKEALDSEKAGLQASGILNSNVLPAYQQRSARDLALTQQDLSEKRDARASEMDAADTQNLMGVIERRKDTGPDQMALLNLAMQYEQSQQAQKNAEANRAQNAALLAQFGQQGGQAAGRPVPIGAPIQPGGIMPIFANGNPFQFGMNYLNNFNAQVPQYGVNYTPRERTAPDPNQAAAEDMKKWLSGRRSLPTYAPPRNPLDIPYGPPQGPAYA